MQGEKIGVVQIDRHTGKVVRKYTTIKAAAAATKISVSTIYRCLLPRSNPDYRATAGGFVWITQDRYDFLKKG